MTGKRSLSSPDLSPRSENIIQDVFQGILQIRHAHGNRNRFQQILGHSGIQQTVDRVSDVPVVIEE